MVIRYDMEEQFTHYGMDVGDVLSTVLAREIRKTINEEMIDSVREGREPDLIPMTFESEADREQYKENFEKMINREI